MQKMTRTDVLSGLLLVIVGLAFTLYCWTHYDLGTLRRTGPGMFPVLVGLTMTLCGGIGLATALVKGEGTRPEVELRSLAAVIASLAVFSLLIRSAGIMPAVFAMTLVSGLAQARPRFGRLAVLGAGLSVFAAGLFGYLLNVSAPIAAWPF